MRRAIAVLLPVLLLTGCAPTTPDAAYLASVRESIPALQGVADDELTSLGHSVCDLFDAKSFDAGMVSVIVQMKKIGLTAKDAGAIAGAATGAYCQKYSSDFP
jgi:hypothetical protein